MEFSPREMYEGRNGDGRLYNCECFLYITICIPQYGTVRNYNCLFWLRYYWSDGSKAYFSTSDVTDSSLGDCVYIDISSNSLKGTDCSTARNFICQTVSIDLQMLMNTNHGGGLLTGTYFCVFITAPIQCPLEGSLYASNGHCYVLKTGTYTWNQASSQCQALGANQARLAVIDSQALENFIVSSVMSTQPYYLCEYTTRGLSNVPTYIAGMADLEKSSVSYGYNLTALPTTSSYNSGTTSVSIFPGLWFSHSGNVRSFNFRSKNITNTDVTLLLQVYRPTCTTGTLLQPGCGGSGARFASCVSSPVSCTAAPTCSANQDICYLTNTCGPIADPCNCAGSSVSYCNRYYVNAEPSYVLVNQVAVNVPDGSSTVYKVTVPEGFLVQEHDVLAFQTNSVQDVILCETDSSSLHWQQDVGCQLEIFQDGYSSYRNDTACYFQAVYTTDEVKSLSDSLSYFTSIGTYTYQIQVPVSSHSQTCEIVAQEPVGTLTWIYPEFVSGLTNTFYVEHGLPTYFVLRTSTGSHLTANWSLDNGQSDFDNSCPTDVKTLNPTACDSNLFWPSSPFTNRQLTLLFTDGATQSATITVYNNISQATIEVTIKVVYPINGTEIKLQTPQRNNYVETGAATKTIFETQLSSGSPTSYVYTVNGTVVFSGTAATLTYTFTTTGFYTVGVNASDILNWQYAEMNVTARVKSYLMIAAYDTVPTAMLVNSERSYNVSVLGQPDAVLSVIWDFGNSDSTTSSITLPHSTSPYVLSETYNYTSTGQKTLNVSLTDEFDYMYNHVWTFYIVDAISSISLTASGTFVEVNSLVNFNVTLLETGNFGPITYTFDFNDGTSPSSINFNNPSKTFTNTGTYNVSVTASNVASSVTTYIVIKVEQSITGLVLTGNNPALVNSSITYTASTTTGSDMTYEFSEAKTGQTSGPQSSNTFNFLFSQLGTYNLTVSASNNLNSGTASLSVLVISADTLEIQSMTTDAYIAVGATLTVTLSVLHHDTSTLSFLWNFDDGTIKKQAALASVTHTYLSTGTKNITALVEDSSISKQVQSYTLVTVQQVASSLTVTHSGDGNITSAGPAQIVVTATVGSGTDLTYTWSYDGTEVSTTASTYTISYNVTGTHTVYVNVSNQISSVTGSTTFNIREAIEGLSITCDNCVADSSGNLYLATSEQGNFTATKTLGNAVSYSWSFSDGTASGLSSSPSVIKSFSSKNNYTVILSASNVVNSMKVVSTAVIQDRVTGLSLNMSTSLHLTNSSITFSAILLTGTSVEYTWTLCDTCTPITTTVPHYTYTGGYTTKGSKSIHLVATNRVSSLTANTSIYVADPVDSIDVITTLLNTHNALYAETGVGVNFTAIANTEEYVQYQWYVDSTPISSVSSFIYTYTNIGIYLMRVEASILTVTKDQYINVFVEEGIQGVSISSNETTSVSTYAGIQLITSITAGSNESYSWALEDSNGKQNLTSTSSTISWVFTVPDMYIFTVTVYNHIGSESETYTVTAMHSLSGVSISSSLNTTHPYIANGTSLTFSAFVLVGVSYTVNWTIESSSNAVLSTSQSNSFTYLFPASDVYTLTMIITNPVSSTTNKQLIYVEIPVINLSVAASTLLTNTSSSVTFEAVHNADANNLNYEWTIEGVVTTGSKSLTHTFNAEGIYIVSVRVFNNITELKAEETVIVQATISGLSVTGCDGIFEIGNVMSVTGAVSTGTNVTYSWTVLSTTTTDISYVANPFQHSFSETGYYTLFLNASNLVDWSHLKCNLTIIGPILNLQISMSDSIYFYVNYSITFTVSGTNLIGVMYNFTFQPNNEVVSQEGNSLAKTFLTSGSYTIQLTVYHYASTASISSTFIIKDLLCDLPLMSAGSLSSRRIHKSNDISFETIIDTLGCTHYTLQYYWTIYSADNCSVPLNAAEDLSGVTVNHPYLFLPNGTLNYGTYCVELNSNYSGTPLINTLRYELTVFTSNLIPIISSGSNRLMPNNNPVTLDGRQSYDPDYSTTSLQHSWACSMSYSGGSAGGTANDGCVFVSNQSTSTVQIPATHIIAGQVYNITLMVSSNNRATSITYQKVCSIIPGQVYNITLMVLSDSRATSITYQKVCNVIPGQVYNLTLTMISSNNRAISSTYQKVCNAIPGQVYNVILNMVLSNSRASAITCQKITIDSNNVPMVTINCLSCSAENNYKVTPDTHLVLKGECYNCGISSSVTYLWTVEYDTGGSAPSLSGYTSTGTNKAYLVIEKGYFENGRSYVVKLQITQTVNSVTTTGSSELNFEGNYGPTGGTCTLTTPSITPLSQVARVDGPDADSTSSEINYRVVTYSNSDPAELSPVYYGTYNSPSVYVAPWPGTSRSSVNLTVYVEDEYGARVKALSVDVNVNSVTLTNTTKTDFLNSTAETTLIKFATQNNPSAILQYSMALLHEVNEESRLSAPGESTRSLLRNVICVAALGVPVITKHDRHQMAFVLEHLTKYANEFQTSACQNYVITQMSNIKAIMKNSVKQGFDDGDFMGSHLLATISNVMSAVNAGYYSSSSITSTTLDTSQSKYIPPLSTITISNSLSGESDLAHRQSIVTSAFNLGEEIMTLLLMTQVEEEEPIQLVLEGIVVFGKRAVSSNIEYNYQLEGVTFAIPSTSLNGFVSSNAEVFQIVMVLDQNPFTWETLNNMQVNSMLASLSFTNTTGGSHSITGLTGNNRIKMFLFNNDITPYNITGQSLITSSGYNPKQNMEYSSTTVTPGESVKVDLTTSQGYSSASLHIQVDFEFLSSTSAPSGVNPLDEIDVYLGKNEPADRANSIYEQRLQLTKIKASSSDHRDYTIFVSSSDFDTSATYTLTVYNDDSYHSVNVTVGIYFSSCQYYNTQSQQWDSSGCTPTSESITTCSVCSCSHLTAFGSSMLMPISAIDFTDILRIDLNSNPIAFITCSIVFIVYVVAVFVCRKMDQLDLDRISVVPLCGKDGSFKYEITVVTGRKMGAGTTAHIGIKLHGDYGKSKARHLTKKGAFQRNCSDSFLIAHDINLGSILKISIWHDNYGLDPNWYLDHVVVRDLQTDRKYYFFANQWLSLEMDNGFIQKDIMASGAAEMQRFGKKFKYAVPNCVADRHLWVSLLDRPAHSRMTRVQRATVCVTLIYSFMFVNAMWYGLIKQEVDTGSTLGWSSFGWEEVVVALVTNVTVFPLSLIIMAIFKKSKSQSDLFEHGKRAETAETIEIENACDASQYSSFRTQSPDNHDLFSNYDRESTADSIIINHTTQNAGLRRTRTLAPHEHLPTPGGSSSSGTGSKRPSSNSSNSDTIGTHSKMASSIGTTSRATKTTSVASGSNQVDRADIKLRRTNNPSMWKEQQRDSLEWPKRLPWYTGAGDNSPAPGSDFKNPESEAGTLATGGGGGARPKTFVSKRASITSIGGVSKPSSAQSGKGFNPREEANISEKESSTGNNSSVISRWASKLRNTQSQTSIGSSKKEGAMPEVEPSDPSAAYGPLHPDEGLATHTSPRDIIQFIMVFLYVYNFGPDRGLEWTLALMFAFAESFFLIEPLKALFIAFYMAAFYKRLEQQDEDDIIDIGPTVDTSVERVKEVKFKPLGGFALVNAREDGLRIQRMRLLLRQFIAYFFYLWLLMVICYVNFSYDTFVFSKHIETQYTKTVVNNKFNFDNMSKISDVWTWSQSVLIENLHLDDINENTENSALLGIARLRQIRGKQETCIPYDIFGSTELSASTCSVYQGNSSWNYYTDDITQSRRHDGHVFSYGGGGYTQNLGTTYNESLTILQDLQNKSWIDLQTRAVFVEFTLYNPATDLSSVVNLMIEFPLTGAINTSYEIQTQRFLRFVPNIVDPLMVCEAIFFLVLIYLIVHIIIGIKKERKQFFTQFWNWFQLLTTTMAVAITGLYIGCVVEATDKFNTYFNNKAVFTNFEGVSDIHIAMRYTHAWLLFLLMFQVVKQVRFIKFLQVYEKTLSLATTKILGALLIFTILLLTHAMVGYLFYGAYIHGFENFELTLMTLFGVIRGNFNFWELLAYNEAFTHFYFYSYYIFTYGLVIALLLAIMNDTYRSVKSQMYYKSTLEPQDYEMIDFMMKRFKLWAGITKPKPEFRKVRFFDQESAVSSRCSSAVSRQSLEPEPVPARSRPASSRSSSGDAQNHGPAVGRLTPTWSQVLDRLERVSYLDSLEDDLLKQTLRGIDEWKWQTRIHALEKERQSILTWKNKPPPHPPTTRQTATPHRTMTEGRLPRKAAVLTPNSDSGHNSKGKTKRPLSDQGGRAEQEPARRRSIYEFFKSIKPSKPAWTS
ncbi:hypothetical protein KUTeg_003820 [Tegillarca granosa]|uniref:Polycystin-1 n=1 Tax=Tegillarca granosa TaxID=220873 RepID=A0ABQ9FN75_TEGGR|nr:hypothetical protein KUTeg_003820 [Tegillarca granosa]